MPFCKRKRSGERSLLYVVFSTSTVAIGSSG